MNFSLNANKNDFQNRRIYHGWLAIVFVWFFGVITQFIYPLVGSCYYPKGISAPVLREVAVGGSICTFVHKLALFVGISESESFVAVVILVFLFVVVPIRIFYKFALKLDKKLPVSPPNT
jgi:hypothetical protein